MKRFRFILAFLVAGIAVGQTALKSGINKADMDPACKPCDDFWRFANGGWLDRNPIPARYSSWGSFVTLEEENLTKLRTILEDAAKDTSAPAGSNTQKIGAYYGACMDFAAIDGRGWDPIKPYFESIDKISNKQQLGAEITALQTLGLSVPIRLFADADYKDSANNIAMLIVSGLTLPEREYYLKEDERSKTIRAEYLKYVARLFELTGVPAEQAKKNADLVMAFETKLATARMNIVDRRDPNKTYNKTDEKGLTATAPSFNWKALLDSTNIPVNVPVNVMDSGALKGFEERLKDTSIDDWKIYLKWKMLAFSGDSLSKPFRDEEFRFNQGVLRGVKEQKPRWQTCAAEVDNALGEVLGQEFVKKYFPPAAKQRMADLVTNLQATLAEEVSAATWLTADTKKEAKLKLESFLPKIGYPSKWREYSGLKIDSKDYFANAIAARKFDYRYNLEDAGKPVDRMKWQMTPPTVNAYYNPSNNEIVFPAGILQPPFFDMNADDAFNYGAIGAVIGHEMGHGFDDQGSKFDSKGNLRNWWTDDDRKKFEERAACIIDQFDNIDVGPGLRHNGRLVTGEALGDVGGLTLAYKAYKRSLRGKPEPPVIEGYTADQRFFLSFARVWAVNRRPEAIRMQLQTDPHPIAKYRANGTLADMPEFQKAFNCKAGDPMVRPAERQCKLW